MNRTIRGTIDKLLTIAVLATSTSFGFQVPSVAAANTLVLGSQGVRIAPAAAQQDSSEVHQNLVSDGSGNYYTAFADWRNGNMDTYAQKFDADGNPQWASGGVSVAGGAGFQFPYGITYDGAGGIYVVWLENSASTYMIQHLDSSGAVVSGWNSGIAISDTNANSYGFFDIQPDGSGGAIMMYVSAGREYATRIDSSGTLLWGAYGTEVSDPTATPTHGNAGAMVSDGAGGGYFAWNHSINGGAHSLRMVKLDSSGAVVSGWTTYGTIVSSTDETIYRPALTLVGSNVVIAWSEGSPNDNIKAQMYDASGNEQWTAGGVTVTSAADAQTQPWAIASGTGVILAWSDHRVGSNYDLYAQRLDASGAPQWTADGIAVSSGTGNQGQLSDPAFFRAVTDGADGALITWVDTRSGNPDIYADRIDSSGTSLWQSNGLAILVNASGSDYYPGIVSDGSDGAVFLFSEYFTSISAPNMAVQHLVNATATNDATLSNDISLSRLTVGTASDVDVAFDLQNTLYGTLTVTFPSDFHILSAATGGSCSGGGSIGSFGYDDFSRTLTAVKVACSGTVTMTGAKVINPSSPGLYYVSWTNDDPGGSYVAIVDSDQVNVSADVTATITFDIDTATSDTESAAPYAVALGALTTGAVNGSDESGVNSIWIDLDTNASTGAVVTVSSTNSALASISNPSDAIPSISDTMASGTANYGICVAGATAASGSFSGSIYYSGGTCTATPEGNDVGGLLGSPLPVLDSSSLPVEAGRAEIMVDAAIDPLTAAHNDYSDTLTFIATGTF